jgi:hypothetical protein
MPKITTTKAEKILVCFETRRPELSNISFSAEVVDAE